MPAPASLAQHPVTKIKDKSSKDTYERRKEYTSVSVVCAF